MLNFLRTVWIGFKELMLGVAVLVAFAFIIELTIVIGMHFPIFAAALVGIGLIALLSYAIGRNQRRTL